MHPRDKCSECEVAWVSMPEHHGDSCSARTTGQRPKQVLVETYLHLTRVQALDLYALLTNLRESDRTEALTKLQSELKETLNFYCGAV